MGTAPTKDLQSPDYFYSKTLHNENNSFCLLPREILYQCIPLSCDLKIERKNEEKKIKSFTKADYQESTVGRLEEIFSKENDTDVQKAQWDDFRKKVQEKNKVQGSDEKLLVPLGFQF